jgi:hypothetical protein
MAATNTALRQMVQELGPRIGSPWTSSYELKVTTRLTGGHFCSDSLRSPKARLSFKGAKTMPNESPKKPQPETQTKESVEWKIPTLADLLQRLSVNSATPSTTHNS